MWFCFNDAFVSVVQSKDDPNVLMVRARKFEHLRTLFGPQERIHVSQTNDYRFRVFTNRVKWSEIVTGRINDINYSNFKDSVADDKLHRMYEEFWFLHMMYQNGKKWYRKQTEWLHPKPQQQIGSGIREWLVHSKEGKV